MIFKSKACGNPSCFFFFVVTLSLSWQIWHYPYKALWLTPSTCICHILPLLLPSLGGHPYTIQPGDRCVILLAVWEEQSGVAFKAAGLMLQGLPCGSCYAWMATLLQHFTSFMRLLYGRELPNLPHNQVSQVQPVTFVSQMAVWVCLLCVQLVCALSVTEAKGVICVQCELLSLCGWSRAAQGPTWTRVVQCLVQRTSQWLLSGKMALCLQAGYSLYYWWNA